MPTFTALVVTNLLETTMADLVDYAFTAEMENELDQISIGQLDPSDYLRTFYLQSDRIGLKERVKSALASVDARSVCTIPLVVSKDQDPVVVRVGRFGPFLESGERRVDLAETIPPDELTARTAFEMLAQKEQWPKLLGTDPDSGEEVLLTSGPFGMYVQLGPTPEPVKGKKKKVKPRRAGLLKGMNPDDVDLRTALRLLSLPRNLGKHPEHGEDVFAAAGRYGPYIKCGTKSRSLPSELNILDVNLDQAIEVLATPTRRGAAGAKPGRELGPTPDGSTTVKLKSGRYGPYVTDGKTNASLPKGTDPETLTLDEALQLIEKRANSPRKRRRTKRVSTRKRR